MTRKETAESATELLSTLWWLRIDRKCCVHIDSSVYYKRKQEIFNLINIMLSIVVLFLANAKWLTELNNDVVNIALSCASALVVVTGTWQIVASYGEKFLEHKAFSAGYSSVQKKFELAKASGRITLEFFAEIKLELDLLSKVEKPVPVKIWKKYQSISVAIREVESKLHKLDFSEESTRNFLQALPLGDQHR
jgi:hypothetical protein